MSCSLSDGAHNKRIVELCDKSSMIWCHTLPYHTKVWYKGAPSRSPLSNGVANCNFNGMLCALAPKVLGGKILGGCWRVAMRWQTSFAVDQSHLSGTRTSHSAVLRSFGSYFLLQRHPGATTASSWFLFIVKDANLRFCHLLHVTPGIVILFFDLSPNRL